MFVTFKHQGQILGVFNINAIIGLNFNPKTEYIKILFKIGEGEDTFLFPATKQEVQDFVSQFPLLEQKKDK